jgi:hypothetical protein
MPYNGSGGFEPLPSPDFPAVAGEVIESDEYNNVIQDILTGLSSVLVRDGQAAMTGNLPMGGNKVTGAGVANANGQYTVYQQVLVLRGALSAVNWNTITGTGIYDITSASLTGASTNFPPTVAGGVLLVFNNGLGVIVQTALNVGVSLSRTYNGSTWTAWTSSTSYASTVAELRDISPEYAGQQISVSGHTVQGIGGGVFVAVAGSITDNNWNLIDSARTGYYWMRIEVYQSSIVPAARDIIALTNSAFNTGGLTNGIMLQKLRTDYLEFSVYTALSTDGLYWARWLFTNRFNDGNAGAPRMLLCSLAQLYASTQVAHVASNKASGTTTTAAINVYTSSSATTTTGTWTAPATINTVTDVSYSTTNGDKKVWTTSGNQRLVLRGVNVAANGGIANVKVFTDAGLTTEIPDANYQIPVETVTGRRLVSFASSSEGLIHIPIANGLDSGTTYYVVVEVDATNNNGVGRCYQAGVYAYANIAYNAVSGDTGIHGVVDDAELPGGSGQFNSRSYFSGTTAIYKAVDATKIDWRYVETTSGSIVQFKVYNSSGVEISTYENASKDTYAAGSTARTVTVAKGLTKDTYYLHVVNGKTRNASNTTGYRYYDYGIIPYDETSAGVLGVDEFDNNDVPLIITDPNNDSDQGSEYVLIGTGNLELALEVRKTTSDPGDEEFVGGIHSYESTPTPIFYVDGAVIDFAGAAQFDTFTGKDVAITFTTTLYFPEEPIWKLNPTVPYIVGDIVHYAPNNKHYECNSAPTTGVPGVSPDWTDLGNADSCMTVTYSMLLAASGYTVKTGKEVTTACVIHDEFSIMLNCPNTATTPHYTQGKEVGGGFKYVCADTNYTINSYDNSSTSIDPQQLSVAFVNSEYMVVAGYVMLPEVPVKFLGAPYEVGEPWCLIQDRTDRTVKFYTRAFSGDPNGDGCEMEVGDEWTHAKNYKISKSNSKASLGFFI